MNRESGQIVVRHKPAAHDRYVQALCSFAEWSRASRAQLDSMSDASQSISFELLDTSIHFYRRRKTGSKTVMTRLFKRRAPREEVQFP